VPTTRIMLKPQERTAVTQRKYIIEE